MSYANTVESLSNITTEILTETQACRNAKAKFTTSLENLDAITTKYAEAITEIGTYGTANAAEANEVARFDKLVADFVALRPDVVTAIADLAKATEF